MSHDHLDDALIEKAKKIKLLILDIDGVCTDGKLYFNDAGECMKVFHSHDGLGIRLAQKGGIDVAIISARQSEAVVNRMKALGVEYIYQGYHNKCLAYEELLDILDLKPEAVAYLGDDLPDMQVMQQSGLGIAVANAANCVKRIADIETAKCGGHGAVREVCAMLLSAQDKLDHVIAPFYSKTV
jgi:3-deoxy-D-manno-octulosonate 8-phosphate phosphatase (KDO 8-P phosphatase)